MRLLILLALAAALAGCTQPPPAAQPQGNLVHSLQKDGDNVFDPPNLSVKVGERVTWDVVGPGHHTVTFKTSPNGTGAGPDSGNLAPGQTFELAFPKAGTYEYWCRYHSDGTSGMAGKIVVA